MASGKTLILGIAIGALGIVLYNRLREVVEEEDPEQLMERLSRQLDALESKVGGAAERPS